MSGQNVLDGSMESQLVSLYADREKLERHFGFSEPGQMAIMVGNLEQQLRDFYDRLCDGQTIGEQGTTDVSGLESQLCSLYAERQELMVAIGVSEASEIIGMVRNLETQLRSLYAEREAAEILKQVKSLEVQVKAFSGSQELPEVVALVNKLSSQFSSYCSTNESSGMLLAA